MSQRCERVFQLPMLVAFSSIARTVTNELEPLLRKCPVERSALRLWTLRDLKFVSSYSARWPNAPSISFSCFRAGIGIDRNLRQMVKSKDSPMDGLWGTRGWRQTPLTQLLAGSSAPLQDPEGRLERSWVLAFCERVATLGYRHFGSIGPLRNEQNAPMYHLLFFSKHEAGLKIWRGIGQIDPRGQRSLPLD